MIHLPKTWSYVEYPEIDSTSEEAKRLIERAGLATGTTLFAKRQTAGRGTHGKRWESLEGNLFTSIVLQAEDLGDIHQYSFVVALAVSDAIKVVLGEAEQDIHFKWPNDIMANKAKVGGILIETQHKDGQAYVIVGVGVNLTTHPTLPSGAGYQATDLMQETGVSIDPEDFLSFLTQRLDRRTKAWQVDGFQAIREAWLEQALGLGQTVTLKTDTLNETGVFVDVSKEGGIILSQTNDVRKTFYAGVAHFQLNR